MRMMDVDFSSQMAESNRLEQHELVKRLEEYRDAFSEDRISEAFLPDACLPSFRDMKRWVSLENNIANCV